MDPEYDYQLRSPPWSFDDDQAMEQWAEMVRDEFDALSISANQHVSDWTVGQAQQWLYDNALKLGRHILTHETPWSGITGIGVCEEGFLFVSFEVAGHFGAHWEISSCVQSPEEWSSWLAPVEDELQVKVRAKIKAKYGSTGQ